LGNSRQRRQWIKVQLAANPLAEEAASLVKRWKTQRQAAANLVRAVRLYAALCQGDVSVLAAYFPGLVLNAQVSPPTHRAPLPPPTATFAPKSETEDLCTALDGLGLDNLDFSQ
jgi:hypothetical protein